MDSQVPQAEFTTVTGSPFWGRRVEEVLNQWVAGGWTHRGSFRPETPYGLGPEVFHFVTRNERSVLWIPSYGGVPDRDWKYDQTENKVFWILWQAGVRVLLIGGTSGSADWRDGKNRIEPGDLVLPTDFRTSADHRGLPGTPFETAWPKNDLLLDKPFCPVLAKCIEKEARGYEERGLIRKVHTPADVRVALVIPDGITYETDFDIEMWMTISRLISERKPDLPSRITLHGDCINPVLARLLGIHVAYYHLVANWAQGNHPEVGIVNTLYPLYLDNFPKVAVEMEQGLLETMPIPDGDLSCLCIRSLRQAPEVFNLAMTQGKNS